jgi:hypothetical protein
VVRPLRCPADRLGELDHGGGRSAWLPARLHRDLAGDLLPFAGVWFEPGRFTYQYSAQDNVVFIDRAEVALHDEAQSMLASGNLQGSGKLDPLSRSFACEWTNRMAEVERAEPMAWKDMHNVFRAFACAHIIAARRAFEQTGLDTDLLLHRLPIATVPVPMDLPGVGQVIEEINVTKSATVETTEFLVMPVCGGVSAGFHGDRLKSQLDVTGATQVAGRRVIARRPDNQAVCWVVAG